MPSIEEFTPEFFDECSDAWMKNKMRKGASMAYVCVATTKDGNQCTRSSVIKDAFSEHLCKQHAKYHINKMAKDE
jgi:hypothetical protein